MKDCIYYFLEIPKPSSRLFHVRCLIPKPAIQGQVVYLPSWLPGSYMIRDFAKQLFNFTATSKAGKLAVQRVDKNTWIIESTNQAIELNYQIYANDYSPRGAYIDSEKAFLNGSRIFVAVKGQEDKTCIVELKKPEGADYKNWRVATSMSSSQPYAYDFGQYQAQSYEAFIDHPIEMGLFELTSFYPCEIQHDIVISGKHSGQIKQFCEDSQKICEYFLEFFGKPYPIKYYVFLLHLVQDGYGGLEHRSSTTLLSSRRALEDNAISSLEYQGLLGLIAHEYFHLWNVKRIKPEIFMQMDLHQEVYTRQLWIFEGFTSYYDDLVLVRLNLMEPTRYLQMLSEQISKYINTPGRLRQTVEEASFEAWIKFYKPDEYSPNLSVSYYQKGSLIALCLDLLLRHHSKNGSSLDTVMKVLWRDFGRKGIGLPEGAITQVIEQATGYPIAAELAQWISTTEELPLQTIFSYAGIACTLQTANENGAKWIDVLGIRLKANATNEAQISYILPEGSAEAAGLLVSDIIIAVNDYKVDKVRLENYKYTVIPATCKITLFRDEYVKEIVVPLLDNKVMHCSLQMAENPTTLQAEIYAAWLNPLV